MAVTFQIGTQNCNRITKKPSKVTTSYGVVRAPTRVPATLKMKAYLRAYLSVSRYRYIWLSLKTVENANDTKLNAIKEINWISVKLWGKKTREATGLLKGQTISVTACAIANFHTKASLSSTFSTINNNP